MPYNPKPNNIIPDIDNNGPVQKRGCTNILCLLIFIAFIAGMFAIAGYAIHNGKPQLIGRGYDADDAGRICLPSVGVTFAQISDSFIDSDLLGHWVSDLRTTWPIIAASAGIAFVIGLVYVIFVRYCAGIMTWLAILFFIVGSAILGWQFYDRSVQTKKLIDNTEGTGSDSNLKSTEITEKIIAGICWGVTALSVLTVFCLFNRIRLAIGILTAASDYIRDTWSVMLVPPVFFVILLAFYAFWGITAVYWVSSGTPNHMEDIPVGTFEFNHTVERLLIYHLIALLWCNAFVLSAAQFVIASSVCIWYFSQGTGQAGSGSIRLFRYHLGSLAFGSLILSIVQFIRWVFVYMEKKSKQWADKEGGCIRFILCCLQCYVGCFERFIKFLNKTAWIQMAISGKRFCVAASEGFSLAVHNPLRYDATAGIGSVFVAFGKLFVAAISTLIGFVIITQADKYSNEIYSSFIPSVAMFLFTYAIGALFLDVYGMASDTILMCFLTDEANQGKRNAPALHCPSSLKSFLDKHRTN